MNIHPIFIAGSWRQDTSSKETFQAHNPKTGELLPDLFPVSEQCTLDEALLAGKMAAHELQSVSNESIAQFLEEYALEIEKRSEQLAEVATLETGLPMHPRLLDIEIPRTTTQLRQAAAGARDGSWQRATIDSASNIRSRLEAMGGPVVVFGPNNFPYAFNAISGGDFAAAIAAGNPVIAKAHPAHPNTSRLLAEAAHNAINKVGLPAATVQMLYHFSNEAGMKLVAAPETAAVAFTGSRKGGMALKAAADAAGTPIYLEMSSLNPVFVLPGAIRERGESIAAELVGSCNLGGGQFCTKPGLTLVVEAPETDAFIGKMTSLFAATPAPTLLTASSAAQIESALNTLTGSGAEILAGGNPDPEGSGFQFLPTLIKVDGGQFLKNAETLQTEAFGPVGMVVVIKDESQLIEVVEQLEGNLTGTLYTDTGGSDDTLYQKVEPLLRIKVGRILNDKAPTGVAVVASMNHGGPFPATGHPGFTAVGLPASICRFAALRCYDAVRANRLPQALADGNPTGSMWRMIDGKMTQGDVPSAV